MTRARTVGACSLAVLVALYVVGAVSIPPGSLRHEVQTLPLWFPIVAGFRNKDVAKWTALPCFIFWLTLMVVIWLFLLGWARLINGHFFPSEIAMTMIVGAASFLGIAVCVRWRTTVRPTVAAGMFVLFVALQFLAFRLSLISYIARR